MKKIENKIRNFLKERTWDDLRPSDLAKSIIIEGAELLELFQWENLSLKALNYETLSRDFSQFLR